MKRELLHQEYPEILDHKKFILQAVQYLLYAERLKLRKLTEFDQSRYIEIFWITYES